MKAAIMGTLAAGVLLSLAILASGDSSKRTPDTMLGLSKTSVFDAPAPERSSPNLSEPGDLPLPERGPAELPPVVPHGVIEYLPITLAENQCADCHAYDGEKEPDEPTPVPPSHYLDLRNAPTERSESLVGARYNCVSCHVAPGNNELLVGNSFAK